MNLVVLNDDPLFFDGRRYACNNTFNKILLAFRPYVERIHLVSPTSRTLSLDEGYALPEGTVRYFELPYYSSVEHFWRRMAERRFLKQMSATLREATRGECVVLLRVPSSSLVVTSRFLLRRGVPYFLYLVNNVVQSALANNRGPKRAVAYAMAHYYLALFRRLIRGHVCFVMYRALADPLRRSRPGKIVELFLSHVLEEEISELRDTCQGERIKLLFVGRLVPYKGAVFIPKAVRLLLDWGYPVELHVLGEPGIKYKGTTKDSYRGRVASEIERWGVREHVTFHGHVPFGEALDAAYLAGDVFLLPSLTEGGGAKVLLEAMAHSLPIVATSSGAGNMVRDGYNGLLVPPASPEALARSVRRLIDEPSERRSLIANGRDFLRQNTTDATVRRLLEELEDFHPSLSFLQPR